MTFTEALAALRRVFTPRVDEPPATEASWSSMSLDDRVKLGALLAEQLPADTPLDLLDHVQRALSKKQTEALRQTVPEYLRVLEADGEPFALVEAPLEAPTVYGARSWGVSASVALPFAHHRCDEGPTLTVLLREKSHNNYGARLPIHKPEDILAVARVFREMACQIEGKVAQAQAQTQTQAPR